MGARPGYSDGQWYGRRRGKMVEEVAVRRTSSWQMKWQSEDQVARRKRRGHLVEVAVRRLGSQKRKSAVGRR